MFIGLVGFAFGGDRFGHSVLVVPKLHFFGNLFFLPFSWGDNVLDEQGGGTALISFDLCHVGVN